MPEIGQNISHYSIVEKIGRGGMEESDGTTFLVLELIEGETLVDRIKAGPIPVEESLKRALQIVEALEPAHEKGVIHRDLKPADVKVTPDGKVKVLDFGLAKAYAGEREEVNLSNSLTLSDAVMRVSVVSDPAFKAGKPETFFRGAYVRLSINDGQP